MFQFLGMIDNYDARKVGRWDNDEGTRMVSTAKVNDGAKPFETAFKHERYNGGAMVIVEAYDSREEALAGHARWEAIMVNGPLPDELRDCANSEIGQMCDAFGVPNVFKLDEPRS